MQSIMNIIVEIRNFPECTLSLSAALDESDATLGYLQQVKISFGLICAQFLREMDDPDPPTAFRGLAITDSKEGIDLANVDIKALTSGAVSYLEKRYSISGVMKDFDIFDPTNWPTTDSDHEKVIHYSKEELSRN